jgi:hypothetical protein
MGGARCGTADSSFRMTGLYGWRNGWGPPVLGPCASKPILWSGLISLNAAERARFFFKKWGGVRKDLTKRMLHGRTYDEMPPLRGVEPCGRSQGFTR